MKRHLLVSAAALALMAATGSAWADEAAAQKWIDSEFQPSTLSKEDQLKEMQWFIKAAEPMKGMEINVLSEGIPTHTYESTVLTKAFEEITGIKVNHQILGEGEVVQAVQTQHKAIGARRFCERRHRLRRRSQWSVRRLCRRRR